MPVFFIVMCVIAVMLAVSAPFYLKIMTISEGQRAEKHRAEVDHLNAMAEKERLEAEMLILKLKEMRGGQQSQ
jgi:hypothetical protein